MQRILIEGGVILDSGSARGLRADLLVEQGRIAQIFRGGAPEGIDAPRFAADGCAVIPGLVNGHLHAHSNMAKGMGDRWTLEMSLTNAPWISGIRTTEEIYGAAAIGAAEMLLKGCTSCYDMCLELPLPTAEGLDAVVRAYTDAGMRVVVAPMVSDVPFSSVVPGLRDFLREHRVEGLPEMSADGAGPGLARLREIAANWNWSTDKVRLALGPAIPMLSSDEFLLGIRDLSREYGIGIHTHLAESKVQTVVSGKRFGESIAAKLARVGLLGPQLTAAHAVWLSDEDIRLLADTGTHVVHNPASNFRLGSGVADIRGYLDARINIGLGTDGATCSDGLNMFEAMRLATHASRIFGAPVEKWLGAAEAFAAATSGSAEALGFGDRIGNLAEGAEADLVLIDLSRPHYVPLNSLLNQIVYGEDSSGVRDVFVGGRCVVRDRKMTTIDYAALHEKVCAAGLRINEASATTRKQLQAAALLAESYCRCFIREEFTPARYIAGQ